MSDFTLPPPPGSTKKEERETFDLPPLPTQADIPASATVDLPPPGEVQRLMQSTPDPGAAEQWMETAVAIDSVMPDWSVEQSSQTAKMLVASDDPESVGLWKRFQGGLAVGELARQRNELAFLDSMEWVAGMQETDPDVQAQIVQLTTQLQAAAPGDEATRTALQQQIDGLEDSQRTPRQRKIKALTDEIGQLIEERGQQTKLNFLFTLGNTLWNMNKAMQQGLIPGGIAAVAGAAAGAPVGGVGAIPGAAAGFTFGLGGGVAGYFGRQRAGEHWHEMVAAGKNRNAAFVLSMVFGGMEAAVEVFSDAVFVGAVAPGARKALTNVMQEGLEAVAKNPTLLRRLGQIGTAGARTVAVETWEEETELALGQAANMIADEFDKLNPGMAQEKLGMSTSEFLYQQAQTAVVTPMLTAVLAGGPLAIQASEAIYGERAGRQRTAAAAAKEAKAEKAGETVIEEAPTPEAWAAEEKIELVAEMEDADTQEELTTGQVTEAELSREVEQLGVEVGEREQTATALEAEEAPSIPTGEEAAAAFGEGITREQITEKVREFMQDPDERELEMGMIVADSLAAGQGMTTEEYVAEAYTPEVVGEELTEEMTARKEVLEQPAPQPELVQTAVETFGTTENAHAAGFITPAGKLLDLGHKKRTRDTEHHQVAYDLGVKARTDPAQMMDEEAVTELMTESGMVRWGGSYGTYRSQEAIVTFVTKPNAQQVEAILDGMDSMDTNLLSMEWVSPEGESIAMASMSDPEAKDIQRFVNDPERFQGEMFYQPGKATAAGKGLPSKSITVFHGTSEQGIQGLDPFFAIETSGAVFFTDNEDVAATFTLPREYGETVYYDEAGKEIEPGDILSVDITIENPMVVRGDEAQEAIDDTSVQGRLVREAKEKGHDGIIFEDVQEGIGETYPGNVYAVFSKEQIMPTRPEGDEALYQPGKDPKAAVSFREDVKATLHATEQSDLSSVVHEMAHVGRRHVSPSQNTRLEAHYGVEDGNWTTEQDEAFAEDATTYVMEGESPSKALSEVFAKIADVIKRVLMGAREKLAPEVRAVFDEIFAEPASATEFLAAEKAREATTAVVVEAQDTFTRESIAEAVKAAADSKTLGVTKGAVKDLADLLQADAVPTPEIMDAAMDEIRANPKKYRDLLTTALADQSKVKIAAQGETSVEATAELQEQAKAQQKSIRQLFAAQKRVAKQAAERERGRIRELTTKRRDKQKALEYMRKRSKQLTRKVPENVDIVERQQIEAMQSEMRASYMSPKKYAEWRKSREYFGEHLEDVAGLKKKTQRWLQKKPLNEWSVAELDEAADEVRRLTELGQFRRQQELKQQERQLKADVETILESVTRGEDVELKDTGPVPTIGQRVQGTARRLNLSRLSPPRVADKMDGGKDFEGAIHELLIDEANDLLADERQEDIRAQSDLKAEMKRLHISRNRLAKVEVWDGKRYSRDMVLDVFAGWLNEKKRAALQGAGMGITPEIAEEMFATITPEEKQLVQHVIKRYNEQHPRVRDTSIKVENKDPGAEDFYTPLMRADVHYETIEAELQAEAKQRAGIGKAKQTFGGNIHRKDIAPEHQGKLRLGLVSTFLRRFPQAEHYARFAEYVQRVQKAFSDPAVQQAVESRFGREMNVWTQNYLHAVNNPNKHRMAGNHELLHKVLKTSRRNAGMAYLTFKTSTTLKQPESLLLYVPEAGPHILSGIHDMTVHPVETARFVFESDGLMKDRSFDRFLEELQSADDAMYNKALKKFGKTGLKGIWFMDMITTVTGWKAVYNKHVEKLGHDGAVRKARNTTLRTQPVGHAQHLPEMFRSANEVMRWLTMFGVQRSQIFNMATYDFPRLLAQGKVGKAMATLSSISAGAAMIAVVSKRRLPDDMKELGEMMWQEALGWIPALGGIMVSTLRGWGGEIDYPLVGAVQAATNAARALSSGNTRKIQKALGNMAYAMGVMAGAPAEFTKDVVEGIREFMDGDMESFLQYMLLGGKPQ